MEWAEVMYQEWDEKKIQQTALKRPVFFTGAGWRNPLIKAVLQGNRCG